MPVSRARLAESASPPVHTASAVNSTEISIARTEPTSRPTMPKCAELPTGLLVPVLGESNDIGASSSAPTIEPITTAQNDSHQLSPSATGTQPSTMIGKVTQLPSMIHATLAGRE